MKILQLDVNYDHSSTGKIVKDIQSGLQKRGHECLALYGRGEQVASSNAIRIAPPLEVVLHAGLTRLSGLTGFFSPVATARTKRIIAEYKPDVLHLHEPHGYYINFESILRYAADLGIGLVWTFHCEFGYTGKCGHALNCENWKTGCGSCPQLRTYPRSEFIDATRLMFHRKKLLFDDLKGLTVTTPSEWLSRRARESIAGRHPVVTIPNPMDTTIFFPRSRSKQTFARFDIQAPIVIVTVGAQIMTPLKGGHLVYEVAASLNRPDIHFLIVGVDRKDAGRRGNVTAIERIVDKNELAALYSASDLLLLPSQKETFSMVCAEALACGTPVIGFDSGAPPFVAPLGYGLFATFPDTETLSNWLDNFEETRSKLHSREDCVRFAVQKYASAAVVDAFVDVYRNACRDKESA